MKYILTAHEVRQTELNGFAAMKADWEKLSFNQQIATINRMLTGIVLSSENRDRFARFVRTVNMPEFLIGNIRVVRVDHGNMLEFRVIETVEKAPVMEECDEETYKRFIEDASDEAEK